MKKCWSSVIFVCAFSIFMSGFVWLLVSVSANQNTITTVEDAPFRSPAADLRGAVNNRFFQCEVSFDGTTRLIRIPLLSVKIAVREDGKNVTTISGTYQGELRSDSVGRYRWLEATIMVPPDDREAWEARMLFYNPELPTHIDPEFDFR